MPDLKIDIDSVRIYERLCIVGDLVKPAPI